MSVNRALSNKAFQKKLAFGQQAETDIARWIIRNGASVLPIYDIEYDTGKGPRLFGLEQQLAAPDLLVWTKSKNSSLCWIETKYKTVFTWYRKSGRWETGIDAKHWRDYVLVQQITSIPVWLLFLHKSSKPDVRDIAAGCPATCPTGLFAQSVDKLNGTISHEAKPSYDGKDGWGRRGMVYWRHESLMLRAPLAELCGTGDGTITC